MRAEATEENDEAVEAVLVYLRETRGFDFTGYKRASLRRRIQRRMDQVAVPGYPEYIDFLQGCSQGKHESRHESIMGRSRSLIDAEARSRVGAAGWSGGGCR